MANLDGAVTKLTDVSVETDTPFAANEVSFCLYANAELKISLVVIAPNDPCDVELN
jgi:hypothetical protein